MSTGGFSFTGFGNGAKPATTTAFGSSTNNTFGSLQTGSGWNSQGNTGMTGMGQQQAAPNPISSLLQSYKYMF